MQKFEEVRYIYSIPNVGLFESTRLIEGEELASIKELEDELFHQDKFIQFVEDALELDENSPLKDYEGRGDFLYYVVCQEGVFSFEDNHYEFVGEFNSKNVKQMKYVTIPNTIFVYKESDLVRVEEGEYEILACEEVAMKNGEDHSIFEIEVVVNECIDGQFIMKKVKVPNYPGIFLVSECDLLDIGPLISQNSKESVY